MVTRPMRLEDVDAASAVSAAAFDVDLSDPEGAGRWRQRLAWPLETDPGGAFVAERDGRVIGVGQALRRERLWCLSLLTVDPTVQSSGAGRALMDATLGYQDGTDAGLIVSSNDPRAMRLYARAGFAVLPTLESEGNVDRSKLSAVGGAVRDGDVRDLDELEAISREVRGAPHTAEVRYALDSGAQLWKAESRGFVITHPDWGVWLLCAR
jgi:ribosomal protein S18 acetylase RimI-like enzyme